MATLRTLAQPSAPAGASGRHLSHDGKVLACRLETPRPGLYRLEHGSPPALVRADEGDRRVRPVGWTVCGDLLFAVETPGLPLAVGVAPSFGRGSALVYDAVAMALDDECRALALVGRDGVVRAARAGPGSPPYHLELAEVARIDQFDASAPVQLELTRDANYVLVSFQRQGRGPALDSWPIGGGAAQEIAAAVPLPSRLSFAVSKDVLGVLETRFGPTASSRLYVRPLAAGSLGALRLGPARDLLFARQALPDQRPAFALDGKKIAILRPTSPPLPGSEPMELALELYLAAGGKPAERVVQARELRGSPHFLENGEIAIDGQDVVSIVAL